MLTKLNMLDALIRNSFWIRPSGQKFLRLLGSLCPGRDEHDKRVHVRCSARYGGALHRIVNKLRVWNDSGPAVHCFALHLHPGKRRERHAGVKLSLVVRPCSSAGAPAAARLRRRGRDGCRSGAVHLGAHHAVAAVGGLSTAPGSGSLKLGQPVPLSNFTVELNSGSPHPTHENVPARFST